MACSELKPLKWMCCCGSDNKSKCKCFESKFSITSNRHVGYAYPKQIKIEAEPIIKKEKTKFIQVPKVQ